MWRQFIIVFVQLIVLPSFSFAQCSGSTISQVVVTKDEVRWADNYDPSCFERVQVCWSQPSTSDLLCKAVPATSNGTTLSHILPCQDINAQVTAVGVNSSDTISTTAVGSAGPPSISGLSVDAADRDVLKLSWSSLRTYSCVDRVQLWICENTTEDLSACTYQAIGAAIADVTLYDYNLPVCSYFSAHMRTASSSDHSDMATLQIYIPSGNQVTNATAVNVTSSSAVLEYSLLVVDQNCTDESLEICYTELGTGLTTVCASYPLEDVHSSGRATLTNLNACTSFTADLRTKLSRWFTGVDFITLADGGVLTNASATNSYGDVSINWMTWGRTSCVAQFNVTWNSVLYPELRWSVLPAYSRSYTIYTSSMNNTLFVNVTAVYVQGGEEGLSLQVDIDSTIINSSSRSADSIVLMVLSAAFSLRFFGGI